MTRINFDSNFNNKLECIFFTTIRMKSEKYIEGNEYEIYMRGFPIKTARIVSIEEIKIDQLSEFIAGIDFGSSVHELKRYLYSTYKNMSINWRKQILYFILLETKEIY